MRRDNQKTTKLTTSFIVYFYMQRYPTSGMITNHYNCSLL